jgi:hypothetical protein
MVTLKNFVLSRLEIKIEKKNETSLEILKRVEIKVAGTLL